MVPALSNRRRVAAAGAALVAVIAAVAIALASAGGEQCRDCAAPDDAIALVPADALAYVHVRYDPATSSSPTATGYSRRCR